MPTHPVRLQLSRQKGARLVSPNGLPIVIVDRRSKWGNPFHTHGDGNPMEPALAVKLFRQQVMLWG